MPRVGFARIDITPQRDCSLLGYEFRQSDLPPGNAGAHDPLLGSVLVIEDGQGPAGPARSAIVSLDLAIISNHYARRLRRRIAEKLGASAERVIVACTHTHSGPFPRLEEDADAGRRLLAEPAVPEPRNPDAAYAEMVEQRLVEAAASAGGLTYPVEVSVREAPLGLAYNRRVMTSDGLKHCWNPQEYPELDPAPAPDPTCTLVLLRQRGGPRSYLLWGVGAHGVVLGKTSRIVSADWPGRACRLVEQYLPGSRSMFFHGASGDAHPWIATQEDPAQIEPVARAAASMVALLAQATRGRDADALQVAARSVTIGQSELDLSVWRLGPAWIVAAPVELFGQLACELRRRIGGPLLLCTTSNGWTGYWPTAEAFDQGGYEVDGAKRWGRGREDGMKLIDELAGMAEPLRGER